MKQSDIDVFIKEIASMWEDKNKVIKVKPFNDLPYEVRKVLIYYNEESRMLGMRQVLNKLDRDLGANQKAVITKWINQIIGELERKYEVEE